MILNKGSHKSELTDRISIRVRFSEVDSMRIVWHGEYLRYFEDGREAFGNKYGLSYMDVYNAGFKIPIVKANCEYKKALSIDDIAVIETRFINTDSAKIIFEYTVFKEKDMSVCAIGSTTQVFLDKNDELVLYSPQIFNEWKEKWIKVKE